MKVKICWTTQ